MVSPTSGPTAPTRPIALNGGMPMPGWFDIYGLDPESPEDVEGFAEATARVEALIAQQEAQYGVPSSKVAVAGFSQGGAVALHVALRHAEGPLAACVAMSSWLPLRSDYPAAFSEHAASLPILQCHGTDDPVVPMAWGQKSHELLGGDLGLTELTWRDYGGMQHSACMEEIADVASFLAEHFER